MAYRILILGGYGVFGSRITRRLADDPNNVIIIAGRDLHKAQRLTEEINRYYNIARIHAAQVDHTKPATLLTGLDCWRPQLVINCAGPFQGQDYQTAECVIRAACHYLDMADARDYVVGFTRLDTLAKHYKVLAVTGVSSVPGLSAAVVDYYLLQFSQLTSIDIGITPGNRAPRGLATVQAILSYCGKPFLHYRGGNHYPVIGWQGITRRRYAEPVGTRWLSYCDVPDLALFPLRYAPVPQVSFRAGLELSFFQLGLWLLSWPVRWGWIKNLAPYARPLLRISQWLYYFGSDQGAMHVELQGIGKDHQPQCVRWQLLAQGADGPEIPCTPAVILARKLAQQQLPHTGAMACVGLFSLEEFLLAVDRYAIHPRVDTVRLDAITVAESRATTTPPLP
ncbi:MAG: saccharopine dehydrogenase NADP-binding domain-containing protein [Gammaproteobacteria bacterium]|nr:saccharopine dehydrogenase NADP-binding domain-containing protein [Gammaproteobacteria bacterium]